MEDPPVIPDRARAALAREPFAFEFGQAVRLLERAYADRAPPGRFVDPSTEVVRFSANPTLAFPASAIQSLELPGGSSPDAPGDPGSPARMLVNFFGLVGPSGVLPHEYTLLVAERLREKDGALAAFLDIFNHRAVSLLYRAWRRNRMDLDREAGDRDVLETHLLDLAGVAGADSESGVSPPPRPDLLAGFAGLLGPQRRSAVALEQLLEGVFDVPVEVQQFVGGWFPIEGSDRTAVGEENDSARLGMGAVAGDEVWDVQARVRIRLGPLGRDAYDGFLPGGRHFELLRHLTRFFAEDQFDFEIQPVLRKDEVPGCAPGDEASDNRLGWSTWIRTTTPEHDADDTRFLLR